MVLFEMQQSIDAPSSVLRDKTLVICSLQNQELQVEEDGQSDIKV